MKLAHFSWLLCLVLCLAGCVCERAGTTQTGEPGPDDKLVSRIQNRDVKWDGTYVGLQPTIYGASRELLARSPDKVVPLLTQALYDRRRYIAAHVLLTKMIGGGEQASPESWNGLHISLLPDGSVRVAQGEQAFLVRQWADFLNKHDARGKASN